MSDATDAPTTEPTEPTEPADRRPGPVARAHDEVVGDRALTEATGRSRADWYAVLDDAGAGAWRHREIASALVRDHGVDAWWAQGITVGYEQSRGIRVPGQRQDGLFEGSVSRTLPVDHDRAWSLVADDAGRAAWLDIPVQVTGATPPSSVRWALPDGTRAVVRVEPVRPGATRVVVQHARLPDADAATSSKAAWKDRLDALAQQVTGG